MTFSASTRLTRIVTRILMGILALSLILVPLALQWFGEFEALNNIDRIVILITFYVCAVIIAPALLMIDRLLGNILKEQVFTNDNVALLQRVCLCCGVVGALCLVPAFVYRPLLIIVLIMVFLWFVLRVVSQVMEAATRIREENDLTI